MVNRLLIIEDALEPSGLEVYLQGREFSVARVSSREDCASAAREFQPHVIFIESLAGDYLCEALQNHPDVGDVPRVMACLEGDCTTLFQRGAFDYLRTPYDRDELVARLNRAIALKRQQDAMARQASTDPLTGVLNRGALMDRIHYELTRNTQDLAILVLDLDHFKQVNDTHGHLTGDMALVSAAETISLNCRSYDAVGRYGGEEFVVVLPRTGLAEAHGVAERIRSAIASQPVDGRIFITASLGLTEYRAGDTVSTLISRADQALYQAKRCGRNRIKVG